MTSSILQGSRRYNSFRLSPPQSSKIDPPCININNDSGAHLMATSSTQSAPGLSSLLSSSYFVSPIRTLIKSITDFGPNCISTHDLIEAYNVLSTRIRSLMIQKLQTDKLLPCMKALQEEGPDIISCVSRDIQRLWPSPFDSPPPEYSYAGQSFIFEGPTDIDDIKTMADNILLCQYALRVASDIFTFPLLYSNFSDDLLVSLLRDVLSLCSPTLPPIPNLDKTCDKVLWMLKVQQLPASILLSLQDTIADVLKNPLSHNCGRHTAKINAFKAIHCIFTRYPIFVDSFIDVLPTILEYLNFESMDLRLSAALALCGFATAKLKSEDGGSYPRSKATELVRDFLDQQTARRGQSSPQLDTVLQEVLQSALANGGSWQNYGPSFAVSVVSSCLVLLDRFLWTSPRSLRLLVQTIAQVAGQKKSNIRNMHPELWRILVWAFSRLPRQGEPGSSQDDVEAVRLTRERACRVVLQEQRSQLALGVIEVLLSPRDGERSNADVKKVMEVTLELVNSDKPASVEDASRVLGRLVAGIGTSSVVRRERAPLEIPFSWTLVDGSLLSRKASKIRVPRVEFDFLVLAPLSEREVLTQWDELSKIWTKAAQHCLISDQNISDLIRVWQALLLVRGDLVEGNHHFTASSAFATTITDILNSFSTPLHTSDQQTHYIIFMSKLWKVLTNVFTKEWLSSPAEAMLVKILEKPFDLSNTTVKEVWSQMCKDLILVGIPALLHMLHVRSEITAGTDITRELWLVAATSDAFIGDDAGWANLLCFLAIPIGTWDMTSEEFETWERVLAKAFENGVKASQSRRTLMSHFFEALTDSKLNSLKSNTRILCSLLSRSLPASFSEFEPKLLPLVDEHLCVSYDDTDKEEGKYESTLQLLRLVGDVIAKTREPEIIDCLCTMQKSLLCWIVDEREVLTAPLHDEIVTLLYKRPLEILAKVEPSIAVLTKLADFIPSVFVRIRGDGVFSFQTFWRATYHVRKDIPKDLYPAQIKACLQAWSDFCEDSFADDIPSDSGSQNLDTSSIPDSQLAESMSFGAKSYPEGYQSIFDPEVNAAAASYGPITPTPRNQVLPSQERMPSASMLVKEDDVPQSFGGRYEESQQQSLEIESQLFRSRNDDNVPSTSKRPAVFETPPSKRRRVDIPRISFKPRAGKERAREPSLSYKSNASMLLSSISEPTSRKSSPIPRPSASQPSQSQKRSSAWLESGYQGRNPETADVDASLVRSPAVMPSSEDDYDSWERGVSAADLRAVQAEREDDSDLIIPDSQGDPDPVVEGDDAEWAPEHDDPDGEILSPSLGEYPLRSRPRYRSQTAPELDSSHSNPLTYAPPLRRHLTSPGPPARTLSVPLDALRYAYAAVTEASQVDMEEILQVRRLTNQINQVLDEQIVAKVTSSRPRTPEVDD